MIARMTGIEARIRSAISTAVHFPYIDSIDAPK